MMKTWIEKLGKARRFEIFLALVVILPHLLIVFGNLYAMLNWFLTDDAFYYFQVARNVSEGAGFTFDGINASNGFQPLWMFVCIPIFSLARFDLYLPLRVLVLVLGIINAGSAIFLYRLLRRFINLEMAMLAGLAWSLALPILRLTTKHGVESGISAFFILLLWERLTALNTLEKLPADGLKRIFWLGLIGALTILARLDNVFLVFFGGVWLWLRWWQPPTGKAKDWKTQLVWLFKSGIAYNGIIIAIMLAYLAWNHFGFGSAMPVSGQVKIWWGTLWGTVYGKRVVNYHQLFAELLSIDANKGPWAMLIAPVYRLAEKLLAWRGLEVNEDTAQLATAQLGLILLLLSAVVIWLHRKFFFKLVGRMGLIPFMAGLVIQIAYYKKYGSVPQKYWYWVGEAIFILIALAVMLTMLYRWLANCRWRGVQGAALLTVVLVGLYYPVNFVNYMFGELANGRLMQAHDYTHRIEYIQANFEPGTVFALAGSGSWGYFNPDYTVFNMDGLINSLEYLEALKEGRGAEILANSGVQYIIGNPYIMTSTNPYGPMLEGHLEEYTKYFPPYGSRKFVWRFVP